jgi:hypothetical protein
MIVLSAVDAISPALERTRQVLFGHRRWQTFVKITFIATLAAMGDGLNMNLNSSGHSGNAAHMPPMTPGMAAFFAALTAAAVIIGIVFFLIFLVIYYVGNRMQFVLFDLVLNRGTQVAPPWRLYGSRVWRWIGAKLLILLGFILIAAAIALPAILHFIRNHHGSLRSMSAASFGVILGSAFLLFCLFVCLFAVSALFHDFVLPAVALEDARIFPTLGRLWSLCKAEPGQIAAYLLLRVLFAILLMVGTVIAIVIVAVCGIIVFGIIGGILYALLHNHGIVAMVLLGIVIGIEALLFIALIFVADFAIVGAWMTF